MEPIRYKIGDRMVGDDCPCFVIAEIGSNHNHDFDQALRLIDAAADADVNAVKFQTFRADDHFSKKAPSFSYLDNCDIHTLIKSLEIDRSWHLPLKQHAESRGVLFFSSPCDADAIAELAALDVGAYKVAAFDLPDTDLIALMAKTGKPVILSTGMADWKDMERAVKACEAVGNNQIILLQCTSLYPAPTNISNLSAMATMREKLGRLIGYSDHTIGDQIALAAVTLGAAVIEKHYTLDRTLPGPDHSFAIEPNELKLMVSRIRDIESAIGDGDKNGPREEEREMFEKGRRSLHARVEIIKGQTITEEMLVTKRPGLGVPPYERGNIIGRAASTDIEADQWITWDLVD